MKIKTSSLDTVNKTVNIEIEDEIFLSIDYDDVDHAMVRAFIEWLRDKVEEEDVVDFKIEYLTPELVKDWEDNDELRAGAPTIKEWLLNRGGHLGMVKMLTLTRIKSNVCPACGYQYLLEDKEYCPNCGQRSKYDG